MNIRFLEWIPSFNESPVPRVETTTWRASHLLVRRAQLKWLNWLFPTSASSPCAGNTAPNDRLVSLHGKHNPNDRPVSLHGKRSPNDLLVSRMGISGNETDFRIALLRLLRPPLFHEQPIGGQRGNRKSRKHTIVRDAPIVVCARNHTSACIIGVLQAKDAKG